MGLLRSRTPLPLACLPVQLGECFDATPGSCSRSSASPGPADSSVPCHCPHCLPFRSSPSASSWGESCLSFVGKKGLSTFQSALSSLGSSSNRVSSLTRRRTFLAARSLALISWLGSCSLRRLVRGQGIGLLFSQPFVCVFLLGFLCSRLSVSRPHPLDRLSQSFFSCYSMFLFELPGSFPAQQLRVYSRSLWWRDCHCDFFTVTTFSHRAR